MECTYYDEGLAVVPVPLLQRAFSDMPCRQQHRADNHHAQTSNVKPRTQKPIQQDCLGNEITRLEKVEPRLARFLGALPH